VSNTEKFYGLLNSKDLMIRLAGLAPEKKLANGMEFVHEKFGDLLGPDLVVHVNIAGNNLIIECEADKLEQLQARCKSPPGKAPDMEIVPYREGTIRLMLEQVLKVAERLKESTVEIK
jgi:hypothetical protein